MKTKLLIDCSYELTIKLINYELQILCVTFNSLCNI